MICIYGRFPTFDRQPSPLLLVLGPHWNMLSINLGTLLFAGYAVWDLTGSMASSCCHFICMMFLISVSVVNPGIMPKCSKPQGPNWTYCSRTQSWRPPKVLYCRYCKQLIIDYHHYCPWIGTVLGKGNLRVFFWYMFTFVATLAVDTWALFNMRTWAGQKWQVVPALVYLFIVAVLIGIGYGIRFYRRYCSGLLFNLKRRRAARMSATAKAAEENVKEE